MNVLIIDGQGGRIGKQLVAAVKKESPAIKVYAVGTNGAATEAMLGAGADYAATGENAARVCAAKADVIAGPIGIAIADSLLGEVTPALAAAVGGSAARKVYIPMNLCDHVIVGIADLSMSKLIALAAEKIAEDADHV